MGEILENLRAPSFLTALIAEKEALRIQSIRLARRIEAIDACLATYDPLFEPDEPQPLPAAQTEGLGGPAAAEASPASVEGEAAGAESKAAPASISIPPVASDQHAGANADEPGAVGDSPADPLRSEAATREDAETAAPAICRSEADYSDPIQDTKKAEASPPAAEVVPSASAAPKMADVIRELLSEHPDYTAGDIVKVTGFKYTSVSTALAAVRREARLAAQKDRPAAPAPSQAPAPEPAPAANYSPSAAPTGRTSPGAIVTKPAVKPKGTRFWLRDDAGRYLHFSCMSMTTDRAYAWSGDERQLVACRRRFSLAAELREQAIEKEPSTTARQYA